MPAVRFSLEIEAGLESIVADELRLRQMLVHLLENALKFTPLEGAVGLRISSWQGWVDFTVWDTGIGIPESAQHLIFQKFQQLESPLTREYEGTGLGLVLTQRLARAHGGEISFISKVGEGSQFTLLLPPVPPRLDRQRSLRAATEPPNQLVLVVEAVPQYIERLTRQLQKLGYRVAIARSGTEALEKARQVQPRAILLNPLLPLLSGWDVLTLLKADARTQDIPVIVTATRAERRQALQNGADSFLSLPVKADELLTSLGDLRDRHPARRDLTLLRLSPNTQVPDGHSSIFVAELGRALNAKAAGLNCRILEADDLEQASILARVWRPDVLLLDGGGLSNPTAYLEALVQYESVAQLPLIALDAAATAAANQFTQLAVYPCLIPIDEQGIEALLQAIQVAAGIVPQPNVLLIGSQPPLITTAPAVLDATDLSAPSFDELLQALVQYLQTAGLRSLLATSWAEVYCQIQQHNVDLLVVDLGKRTPEPEWLSGLQQLQQLSSGPPVLVLSHHTELPDAPDTALTETVRAIATQIIHCPSQSMSELLAQIHQLLGR
ncbi:MAG: response regulator [Spirulinaceae cyanobacterium RM2_2_10]|nr:response regulator [Spirulinaceae cyanobacterium RM2_2_10]